MTPEPITLVMPMSPTNRKKAELVIKRNEIAIKYATEGVGRVRQASVRSDQTLQAIRTTLRRAKLVN